ncbi:MAG: hypothetical protein APR55_02425 [Methanolinea sp. SDB]|nr:MAG: hypothetical protein APR55_02425 [Methanolinea sp. SDB]
MENRYMDMSGSVFVLTGVLPPTLTPLLAISCGQGRPGIVYDSSQCVEKQEFIVYADRGAAAPLEPPAGDILWAGLTGDCAKF